MNAIVRKHYPVSRLPADLQKDLAQDGWVEIEIRPEPIRLFTPERLADVVGAGANVHGDEIAALEHIRRLREDR